MHLYVGDHAWRVVLGRPSFTIYRIYTRSQTLTFRDVLRSDRRRFNAQHVAVICSYPSGVANYSATMSLVRSIKRHAWWLRWWWGCRLVFCAPTNEPNKILTTSGRRKRVVVLRDTSTPAWVHEPGSG